ncbi:MAG: OsmC family protein [Burkholderiaceae bacterium]
MPRIQSVTTRQSGRYLLSARDQHLVADATPSRGGSGEAWMAGELLLAALATCASAVVQDTAHAAGIDIQDVRLDIESETDAADSSHYAFIRIGVTVVGATQSQAEQLVAEFTRVCPIYGSLSRGAPVTVTVRGEGSPRT